MKILVTGGAGFIGAHLCRALVARGDEVVCVDNFATSSKEAIDDLLAQDGFTFIEADICDPPYLGGDFEAVAHLACAASPPDYLRLPLETLAVGSRGSEVVLDIANRSGARALLASTSEVYGDPTVHPQKETYWGNVNPIGPRSVYDESKRFAESLFSAHRRTLATNTGIVRIFNTYGPGLRPHDGRAVSNFIYQALRKEQLTLYGDGSQTRSFCYVSDLVDGLVRMLDSDFPGPVNLGNPTETTLADLAAIILNLTGSRSEIVHLPLPVDDPQRRRPDVSVAAEVLGWAPTVSLEEGLKHAIQWQRELLSTADSHATHRR